MVKLSWEGKRDISERIPEYKKIYHDKFKKYEEIPRDIPELPKNVTQTSSWKNILFWGDNLHIASFLLDKFTSKIDLIYIDPPFYSGLKYKIEVEENSNSYEDIAYFDHWDNNFDGYLQAMYERLILLKHLLSERGLLFLHLDWHALHYMKILLDEIFGEKRFVNDIVWYYYNKYSAGKTNLPRAHDNILVYAKSNSYTFNELRISREKPVKQLKREMVNGVLKNVKDENGHVQYRVVTDKKMDDVWKIPCMQPASKQWTGFPTQKHHKLLDRIIELGSNENDLIADFYCGSSTTLLSAEKLKRRWIGCDSSPYAVYITRRRLISYFSKNTPTHAVEFYTNLTPERENLIKSGFFEKDIKIKRV